MEKKENASSNVTPEEQAQYDTVMNAARTNIFGDKNDDTRFKMVLQRLSAGKDDLATNIGGIAAVTMANIAGAAQQKGREVPGYILFHAGDELVDDLIEVSEGAKLMDPKQRDEVKKQALFEGLKTFGEAQQKGQSPQAQAAHQAELQQAQQPSGAPPAPAAPPPAQAPAAGIIDSVRAGA
jgi:hypothetical protein